MRLETIGPALGVIVHDLDLRRVQSLIWAQLNQLLLQHLVVFFPQQHLSPTELTQVCRRFGTLDHYPFIAAMPGQQHVVEIVKEPTETKNFGSGWHSDTTYLTCPPKATALYAVEVPDVGGDTLFANMYGAYSQLSNGLRDTLVPLRAVNSTATRREGGRAGGNRYKSVKLKQVPEALSASHPVVRTHPETGRKALYVNALHTERFDGMTIAESQPILQYLYQQATRAELTCRYRWHAGTLAIWDNRCVQHYALNDYHGRRRAMRRVSIAGEAPF